MASHSSSSQIGSKTGCAPASKLGAIACADPVALEAGQPTATVAQMSPIPMNHCDEPRFRINMRVDTSRQSHAFPTRARAPHSLPDPATSISQIGRMTVEAVGLYHFASPKPATLRILSCRMASDCLLSIKGGWKIASSNSAPRAWGTEKRSGSLYLWISETARLSIGRAQARSTLQRVLLPKSTPFLTRLKESSTSCEEMIRFCLCNNSSFIRSVGCHLSMWKARPIWQTLNR